MIGDEKFIFKGKDLDFDYLDFWRFQYSNIYSAHGEIAEFIVARALGIKVAQNSDYWTLWDISYRNTRIEVKASAYYHLWNESQGVTNQRVFGIPKANGSYDSDKSGNNEYCRQNDIYVFCLNIGNSKETSYPLNLDNWEFYVVPTSEINKHCKNNKTISLGRIKSLGYSAICYDKIKCAIDSVINEMNL